MSYGSLAKMEALFGSSELSGLAPSTDDDYDRLSVQQALVDASNEVNSYLGGRYAFPLPNVPAAVDRAACDIARYFLYKDQPTDQVAQRYKEVTAWLVNVSKSVVSLVFDPMPVDPIDAEDKRQAPAVALSRHPDVFTDRRLDRMPEACEFYGTGGRFPRVS